MGLRERKKLATRRRIVDAALSRFAMQGYEATTVEEITADADVSVTTFFRYFRSKDELLFIDSDQHAPEFRAILEARPTDESDMVAIHRALREFHGDGGAEDDRRRLQRHKIVAGSPALRGRANEVSEQWRNEVATGLAHRRGTSPEARDARLTAAIALAVLGFAEDEWSEREESGWIPCLDAAFECYLELPPRP